MNRLPWLMTLLLVSCGGAVVPDASRGDSPGSPSPSPSPSPSAPGDTSEPAPGALAPSGLRVTITEPSFTYCDCHHGFGPGIDGTVRVSLRNEGSGAVHVVLDGVLVREMGSPVAYTSNGAQVRIVDGTRVFHEGDLASGTEVDGSTTAYIDPGTNPWPPKSTYVAGLDLIVDGVPQRAMSTSTFTMPYQP